MTRLVQPFAVFAVSCAVTAAFALRGPVLTAQTDSHPSLPAGEGRELMIRVCSQCHEAEKVVGQENDERGWKEVVDEMASNGAQATDEELATIVKYLTKAFPPK